MHKQEPKNQVMDLNSLEHLQTTAEENIPGEVTWVEYLTNPVYTLMAGMLCGVVVNLILGSRRA